jgi:poly(A) polymerase
VLTRADCTTRNVRKAERLARAYDSLEERIAVLREQEELDKIRPDLNGDEIMAILGLSEGPLVGKAHRFLMEIRMTEGEIGKDRASQELRRWAAAEGISPPADG